MTDPGTHLHCISHLSPFSLCKKQTQLHRFSTLCPATRRKIKNRAHKPVSNKNPTFAVKTKTNKKNKSARRKMWFVYVCDEEEKELGKQQAPGSCPHCGGKVEATDVETQWRFCFVPMCFRIKRKFFCTLCSRRLELYYHDS